jgi:hypothetical protein
MLFKTKGACAFDLHSPGTSTRLKFVPSNQAGLSVPPVIPYDGPPCSNSSVFEPVSLNLSATIMPAGPAPTTMKS